MPADAEFATLAEPFRPELLAHCYRILGSIHDAEDLVQETYLRAWRAFDRFEGRSSVRRWLYKIATMACLTALETRSRRPLPSGLGTPSTDHRVAIGAREPSVPWLQPAPDALFGADDPATIVAGKTGIRLAFIAALQLLPARQRAVLTLRDVLAFRTAEVAEMLDTTTAAVDSTLRRARTHLAEAGPVQDDLAELEMPPIPTWFTGQQTVVAFLASRVLRGPDQWRMVPTRANGQPALVAYQRTDDGRYAAYGVQVLTLIGTRIARITSFNDPGLVPAFGLAPALQA